ncbi:MAG TPA: PIN domain-containing protein [Edaphobacter sp.]|jgi:predicted nucleic acid-binding protein|nr:PIN domain-containing protein [Edaphobacter sp.]
MSDRYFLDTNIFIYSHDERYPEKAKTAVDLIRNATTRRAGVVSYQVVQEFFNVVLNKANPPMRHDDAQQYLATVFRPILAVHSSAALVSEAIQLQGRHRLSWYDSLIVAAAMEAKCAILYSEDLQHGQRFGDLTVKNPFR